MEVLFDLLVDLFHLTIGLGVIKRGEIGFNTGHCIEVSHELGGEWGPQLLMVFREG